MADSLLQEVDDALRADRMGQLWHQNKKAVIAFIVTVILGTAANSAYEHYREVKGGHILAQLSVNQQLLSKGKADEAAKGFKTIADSASGEYKDLALVWESRALFAAGKQAESAQPLREAVTNGSRGLWADIACLRLAGLDMKTAEPCLNSTANSPLASTRAEWAAAAQWANGFNDAAITSIEKQLADKDITQDSRERLTQWLATMKAEKAAKASAQPVKIAAPDAAAKNAAKDDANTSKEGGNE